MTAKVVNIGNVRRKARTRPRKYVWLDEIKVHPRLGSYRHLSRRLLADYADLLTTFTSFELEGVYAGRPNLGRRLGVSVRQITRLNIALADMGFVQVERRGRTSNLVVPILNGERLFSMGPEVTSKVTLDGTTGSHRTGVSMGPSGHTNLLEQDLNSHELNSPQPPEAHHTADDVSDNVSTTSKSGESGETQRSLTTKEVETVLNGEIVHPISFSDFWNGSRRHSDTKDKPGPARKAFEALSEEERQEISALLDRDGEIDLGGEWACLWLRARAWREAPLRKSGVAGFFDSLDRPRPGSREDRQERTADARRQFREWAYRDDPGSAVPTTMNGKAPYGVPVLEPYSQEWQAARARRVARREPVSLMDEWAKRGMGWPCR